VSTQDSRTDEDLKTPDPAPQEPDRGNRFLLRNWRVRTRLVALILVPTVAALLLGGLRVFTSLTTASEYQRVNDLARLVQSVAVLTHELQTERDRAAWNAALGRPEKATAAVVTQTTAVNKAAAEVRKIAASVRADAEPRAADRIDHVISRLDTLESLRKQAVSGSLLPGAVMTQYTLILDELLELHDELSVIAGDERLAAMSTSLGALATAKEAMSVQRGLLTTVLPAGRFDQEQYRQFLGALAIEERALSTFRKHASREERAEYDRTVSGAGVEDAAFLRALVLDRVAAGFSLHQLDRTARDDARRWFDAMTQPINSIRTVEGKLAASIVDRSAALQADEERRAMIASAAIALLLIAVLFFTTGVIQSLVRPLRRLRSEALEIAGHRLPETVQRLREAGDAAEIPEIQPIGIGTRDEIGEVARAFDEVHREAVRLAGDEARLRSNVNAMFVNLSRRTQTLVERQLSLIENLEQGEQDEDRLKDLFKLDHLATRMRRNSENLLVLAGQEPARRWGRPVPIVDVVRASLSEVEGYERVDFKVQPGVALVGQAVNDVVHLLAELIENALSFSPRDSKVTVSSSRIDGGGLLISVSDTGIGMTPEEIEQANHRLANPPVVDVSISRRMGLFVVGRLALRHGIRVQLRRQDSGGLTAMVLLPEALLVRSEPAFAHLPGLSQTGATGPMPVGADAPGSGPTSLFEPPQRTPVLGAAVPETGAADTGRFERGTFEPFQPSDAVAADPFARDLFGSPPAASDRSFDTETRPFETASFARGQFGEPPIDTPWPGHVPPPGSTSWPEPIGPETGGWPGDPRAGSFGEDDTGRLPTVRTSPLEADEEEYLPIFAAVESDWFKKADPSAGKDSEGESGDTKGWSSPADAGWEAAKAASEPTLGGTTAAGLPKRVPKANLVPGSAATSTPAEPAASAAPSPMLSPERVRSRLSSFQQGVRQGRAVARGEASGEEQRSAWTAALGDTRAQDGDKEDS